MAIPPEIPPLFPVRHSLLAADALAAHVAETFAIAPVDDCRFWRSFINDVYRIEAGGRRFWLRVHPAGWRSQAQTEAEVAAILAVVEAGGAAARPVSLRVGGHVIEIEAPEGMRGAVLFEDAPGADLSFLGPDGVANARRYGAASARLHHACDTVTSLAGRTPFDLESVVTRPAAVIAAHLDKADQAELAGVVERLVESLAVGGDLTIGFCHGDLNCQNLHFAGETATAIDFDCCALGWRAFELAGFARGVAWNAKPGDATGALIAAQLDGYRQHRRIEPADLAAIPAMLLGQRLWVSSLHLNGAGRWGAINFDRPYAVRALTWLRDWSATLDAPPAWASA
jgi:Ser/Thr protein kinase RdoA (MazF antagonist)